MSKKFIPNGDSDFLTMAERFARSIERDPHRFQILPDDAQQLDETVKAFRAAYQAAKYGERSASKIRVKEDARKQAELIIRKLAHLVRSSRTIAAAVKIEVGINERSTKPTMIPVPNEPPKLMFVRAHHEARAACPMHELKFMSLDWKTAKPEGAVRMELFVDLIMPDEPIPGHPAMNHGGRPWYLRSFTRSPIILAPPMPRIPMRVLYWGRWADSAGEVGPFSETAVGWIEGGAHAWLPGGVRPTPPQLGAPQNPVMMVQDLREDNRDVTIRVAVLEMQRRMMLPNSVEIPDQTKQLEGPAEEAA